MILFLVGIIMTAAAWLIAWSRIAGISEFYFFPLWIGYILLMNGLSEVLLKRSLLRTLRFSFLWLFVVSIPLWWFFEGLNTITKNWEYLFAYPISSVRYFVEASIDFSTVVPAVLSTCFLVYHQTERHALGFKGPRIHVERRSLVLSVLLGLLCFCLLPLFPREAFPLIWIAPILILEPILYSSGLPSFLRKIETGSYLLPVSVGLGTLLTGFFWEFWNFHSMPKWIYHIPYVGFWHVFEMPILGYLGYPFFGLFVFAFAVATLFVGGEDIMSAFEDTHRSDQVQ